MDVWGPNGFVADHFNLLVPVVALSGSALSVYLKRRALHRADESLCPRCGSAMTEDTLSNGGRVCGKCSSANRRDGLIGFSLLLAGSILVGLLLVGVVVSWASDDHPFPWIVAVPFSAMELWLVRGAFEAYAQTKRP